MGHPLSCTGQNLAYRREVYDEVGGFAEIGHVVGGDDVFFMRLVLSRTRWRTVYNDDPAADVLSKDPPTRWSAIVQQKLRHAAKAGHYKGPAFMLAFVAYVFHAMLLVGLVNMLILGTWDVLFLSVWGGRWLADLALLWRFSRGRPERRLLILLPLLEVIYVPYILVVPVVGGLGWFEWKR